MKAKLIRDNVSPGNLQVTCVAPQETSYFTKLALLLDKLQEETVEFRDAVSHSGDNDLIIEEAADLLEVFFALLHFQGIPFKDVLKKALLKRRDKGGFDSFKITIYV